MAEQKTKKEWDCHKCDQVFPTQLGMAQHFDKEHPIPEVDDSFYKDKSTTITLIP